MNMFEQSSVCSTPSIVTSKVYQVGVAERHDRDQTTDLQNLLLTDQSILQALVGYCRLQVTEALQLRAVNSLTLEKQH